jgi:DNA-binding IclR family transcriptional regulator
MDGKVNRKESLAAGGAPALDKGLDLLEVLAAEPGGLTQKQLAVRLGRSVGEIFRMLGVLERRGYIAREPRTGEYGLTLQLFRLATRHPPTRRLQQVALPVMEALATETGLSCHLGMLSGQHLLIVAQADANMAMGWMVKLGAVFPFGMQRVSARVIAAFQSGPKRAEAVAILAAQSGMAAALITPRLDRIAADGHDMAPSEVTDGLVDISCPILDDRGQAVAALTLPFLPRFGTRAEAGDALPLLQDAARAISARIGAVTDG